MKSEAKPEAYNRQSRRNILVKSLGINKKDKEKAKTEVGSKARTQKGKLNNY
jgi:hypothetical protein